LHTPVITEDKLLEFSLAEPGIIHLQTSVPLMAKYLPLEQLISLITEKPSTIFPCLQRKLEIGQKACFTIFKQEKWIFDKNVNLSLSNNSPFFGYHFEIKVLDTII
jgi:dihydroorotase-like cyclic amidohydrolase